MADVRVTSELRGSVWTVEVAVGESVSEGQELIVLESMKTEIPVVAPVAGVVAELRVEDGDMVDERQVLLVLRT